MSGIEKKVADGVIWVSKVECATQIFGCVGGMVQTRLLTLVNYGTVSLLLIFFAVARSLASCGFANAQVQKNLSF